MTRRVPAAVRGGVLALALTLSAGCGAGPRPHPSATENAACPLQGPALRTEALERPASGRGLSMAANIAAAHVCSFGTDGRRGNDRALVLRGPLLRRLVSDLGNAHRLSGAASSCIRNGPTGRLRFVDRSGAPSDVQFTGMCGRLLVAIGGRRAVVLRGPFAELLDSALLYGAARPGERAAPDLTGLTLRAALARTRAAGYELSDIHQVVDPAMAAGRVAFQSPPPGNLLAPDFRDELPLDLAVDLVVADAAPCTSDELTGRYGSGGQATGSNFGSIRVRATGPRACRLAGPLRITGLDARGRRVTDTAAVEVTSPAVLVPRTPDTPRIGHVAYGAFVADIGLSANARDDFDTGGDCRAHQVIPHEWRIALASRGAVVVRNRDPAAREVRSSGLPALVTCRGAVEDGGFGFRLSGTG